MRAVIPSGVRGRWSAWALAAALITALLVAAAPADAYNQKIRDKKGDARFGFKEGDIRSATLRHKSNDRLSFTIKTKARDKHGYMFQGIDIRVGNHRYDIQGTARKVPVSLWEKGDKAPTTVGMATHRERGKRATYTFSEKAIGSPKSFRWRAWEAGPDPPTIDKAPNKGHARHVLVGPQPPQPVHLKARKGRAPFTFKCPATDPRPCRGTLTIVAKHKGRKYQVIEPQRYDVPIGGKKRVKLKLTKAVKKRLKRKRQIVGIGTLTGETTGDVVNFRAVLSR